VLTDRQEVTFNRLYNQTFYITDASAPGNTGATLNIISSQNSVVGVQGFDQYSSADKVVTVGDINGFSFNKYNEGVGVGVQAFQANNNSIQEINFLGNYNVAGFSDSIVASPPDNNGAVLYTTTITYHV
jgi:hypothetical protein